MPYFLVDDQFQVNAKTTALVENEGAEGLAAIGLWTLAGSLSQAKLTDGAITQGDAVRLVLSGPRARKLAGLLVRYGLFDQTQTGWAVHDFQRTHRQNGAGIKLERERRAELKRPEVTRAVQARDGDRCRYCARKVSWTDRRGPNGATYDHVDPTLAAGASNIVVACRSCNSTKGGRTLAEAGMALRPPPVAPGHTAIPAPTAPGDDLAEPDQVRPDSTRTAEQKNLAEIKANQGGPARVTRARVPGQGKGWVREGSGEGEPTPEPGVTAGWAGEVGPAGDVPPDALTPPERRPQPTGSPWHGHHGPPPDVDPQARCERHPEQDMPCRRCARQAEREESSP